MDTRLKHIPSGMIYENRKDAKSKMGHSKFNQALKNKELILLKPER